MIAQVLASVLLLAGSDRADAISVSAAISLREPLREIAAEYERQSGSRVELNFGASGQLMAQVRQGAPVDLYISAAEQQVDELIAQKLLDPATRTIIARNRLVLIVPVDARSAPSGFADLSNPQFKRIAVGEPKTVPAGEYARQALDALKLTEEMKDRLIYGANVRQVLSYVERGEVDAGIVYQTDAAIVPGLVRVVAIAEESWHKPIVYPAAVVSASPNRGRVAPFLEFLNSKTGQRALSRWGFLPPATQPSR